MGALVLLSLDLSHGCLQDFNYPTIQEALQVSCYVDEELPAVSLTLSAFSFSYRFPEIGARPDRGIGCNGVPMRASRRRGGSWQSVVDC
jgi:hypothetical protein